MKKAELSHLLNSSWFLPLSVLPKGTRRLHYPVVRAGRRINKSAAKNHRGKENYIFFSIVTPLIGDSSMATL